MLLVYSRAPFAFNKLLFIKKKKKKTHHFLFFSLVIYVNKVDYNMTNIIWTDFFNLFSISLIRRKQNADRCHSCRPIIDEICNEINININVFLKYL
jgi:hypothetical protein